MMNRRNFNSLAAAAVASLAASGKLFSQQPSAAPTASAAEIDRAMRATMGPGPRLQIAMLVYPQFTALDLIGPHTFLAGIMNADVHLVWKTKDPVPLDRGGTALLPTMTLAECPRDLDVLFVPGGLSGTAAVMRDDTILDFVADRGSRAKYVTSVCTGSLVLGCAGLLKGYRATSHWATRDVLPILGAIPVNERVVEDRNRLTGAGVTSGMDFGLVLSAKLASRTYAEMLQLINEYDPQPPFHAGTPSQAGTAMTDHLRELLAGALAKTTDAAEYAKKRLKA
jgi:cyclohexyl-isocyanide hydratase